MNRLTEIKEIKEIQQNIQKKYEVELAHLMQKYNIPQVALDELKELERKFKLKGI